MGPIRRGGLEVWHGVHWLLRDAHWRTPPLRLASMSCEGVPPGDPEPQAPWRLAMQGVFEPYADGRTSPPPAVQTTLWVEGDPAGVLTVTGQAHLAPGAAPLPLNRLGLCLLHPLSAAGARVEVVHDDGRRTTATLPRLVSPWPPFSGIRTLRLRLASGLWAVAEFEGDSFELEDQRNNADASFKTYSRSNFLPRPFLLEPGALVHQRVRLWVEALRATVHPPPDAPPAPPALDLGALRAGRPRRFALGLALEGSDLHSLARSAAQAAQLAPDLLHLSLELGMTPRQHGAGGRRPLSARQAQVLARMLAAAGAELRLDLAGLSTPQALAQLPSLAAQLGAAGVVPRAVAVFPSSSAAVQAARAAFPHSLVGGGTPDFFVQLNRMDRLPALDFLTFRVCPSVHQADDRTVMDSAQALRGMLRTLQARHPGVPVQVGPSRIAAGRSPLGALAPPGDGTPTPLAATDTREPRAFGIAWAVAQVAAALAHGASQTTVLRWCDVAGTSPWPGADGLQGGLAPDGPALHARAIHGSEPAAPAPRQRGGIWQPLHHTHLQVLGWRWRTSSGTQDWLVHLDPEPLQVGGLGPGHRALHLAEEGHWQRVADLSPGASWPWPAATVLVVEHPAA